MEMKNKDCFTIVNRCLIFVGLFLFLIACTYHYVVPSDYKLDAVKVEKIPLQVALYLNPKTVSFKHGSEYYVNTEYSLGDSFSKGVKNVCEILFDKVVLIDSMNVDASTAQFKAIVVPEIVDISHDTSGKVIDRVIHTKWSIFSINGDILYTNTFTGKRDFFKDSKVGSTRETGGITYQKAMEDSFKNAMTSISSTKWWETVK